MRERSHRKYSPSSAERFFNCPGSTGLIERSRLTDVIETDESIEGTKAHSVLEYALKNNIALATDAVIHTEFKDEKLPIDFLQSIQMALDYIRCVYEEVLEVYGDATLYCETYVNPPTVFLPDECGGWTDVAIFSRNARRLWVIDYKHGAGIIKEARDNLQLKQYAVGFLFDEKSPLQSNDVDDVVMVIIQPRITYAVSAIREHIITREELWDHLARLDMAVDLAESGEGPLVPGREQCLFCPAKSLCPAYEQIALQQINPNFRTVRDIHEHLIPNPDIMELNRIAQIYQHLPYLKTWMKAVEDRAEFLTYAGVAIPGLKLVEPKARRRYHGEPDILAQQMAALIDCPVEDLYRKELIPLTEAEKKMRQAFVAKATTPQLRRAAGEEATHTMAFLTIKEPKGAYSLVPESDPRPAINRVYSAFSNTKIPLR